MPYTPVELRKFGGLRLDVDSQDVGWEAAVSLSNIDLLDDGTRLAQRATITSEPLLSGGTPVDLIGVSGTTTRSLSMNRIGTTLRMASGTTGQGSAWTTTATTPGAHMVAVGIENGFRVYIASVEQSTSSGQDRGPGGVATLRKWTGSSMSSHHGKPQFVTSQSPDNRLVQGSYANDSDSPTGDDGDESTVFFSAAGNPGSWGSGDYVSLNPGDGEHMTAMASWRDMVFVFKETKMFVFYGNSTDSNGDVQFNYRTVDLPERMSRGFMRTACAGEDGLYFATADSIWRTTGGPAVEVGRALGRGSTYDTFRELSFVNGRLYVKANLAGTSTAVTVIWDRRIDAWFEWTVTSPRWVSSLDTTTYADTDLLAIFSGSGAVSSSHYQTGYSDLGQSGSQKTIREFIVEHTGTVGFSVAVDDVLTPDTPLSLAESGQAFDRRSRRGRNMALRFDDVSAASWQVNRVLAHMRNLRTPGRSDD